MRHFCYICILVFLSVAATPALGQSPSENVPKYEFRGAWIATVLSLDWPNTSSSQAQQDELVSMLDDLHEAGINAVFFQVRSEADAVYQSDIEPWSHWLTGAQGTAPDPFYDPLQFAIDEAHKRGMELHAWLNPYRAARGSGYARSSDHVTVTHPEWILSFGELKVLNPGIPDVREHVISVVDDIASRYDVDGIHFDDYFYPYPPDQITDEDQQTFEEFGGDFSSIDEWRRANVDSLVKGVHEILEAVRPEAAWGISPFGIWKNGTPSGIIGLDAFNVVFADAVEWLDRQWIDYLAPQLYWPFGGGQDYGKLAPWWAEHAARNDRHLYPGHALYRSESATVIGSLFRADEVPRQIRYNRDHTDIQGSVFFRAQNITRFHSQGFADSLNADLYRHPALTPIMDWKNMDVPLPAEELTFEWTADEVTLSWTEPDPAGTDGNSYVVYRARSSGTPDFTDVMADPRNIVGITGETTITDRPGIAEDPYHYFVTAVSHNSIESEPSNSVSLQGRATATASPDASALDADLRQNYPNPFRYGTEIGFRLDDPGPVTIRVYSMLGQVVTTLVRGKHMTPGVHSIRWNGRNKVGALLAPGTYVYSLELEGGRVSRVMVVVR